MGKVRRARRESGASLVEFALLAPLLFALLLGMLTGGLSLSRKNSMENAVREGARFGATLPEDADWVNNVRDRVVELAGGDVDTDDVCVELIRKDDAATETTRRSTACTLDATAEPSGANVPVGQCAVKVWAQRTSELNLLFYRRDLTLDSGNVNRYEREGTPATCDG